MYGLGSLLPPLVALVLAPLLPGLISRTKAFIAGRRGPPLLQPYWDIAKCLRRGAVYGNVTSWIFRLGPVVNLAALLAALLILPFGGIQSPVSFSGDLIVLAGLLALGRFATVLAALDTGSSFEGMGASREVHFAALAEPAFLLALAVLARVTGAFSLTPVYHAIGPAAWTAALPTLALVAMTLLILALVENSRIPVDDPTTHLELTMIHEVMVLDHSGPDLGIIQYAAALKLWVLGSLLVGLVVPLHGTDPVLDGAAMLFGMALLSLVIGMIESAMARYRLVQVPQFIVGAATLSAVGFILILV
ncbi:MAG TPA: NADH-quinone oxidoreductase subunit H [Stellaceae bacterium]|nr:NADH-quinone oxidoreductase subunit H [Stellaceae bacterium]